MSYTALYRKYRPGTFDEVRGQDHVVTTLRNQITANRIGHAYLFTGTRGTGKTSVAKIFAKAVNCENPQNGNPCGECASCRGIADGSLINVIEMDAASNNGVDDIRLIREEVAYAPTQGRYKVYIIDEAHMVTQQGFNALLKTLEEPPSYVIFILATTEAHKIPVTILSRCQRYDFRRISPEQITQQLAQLAEREHVPADEKALRCIARRAEGGMRDALSLMDQCIAFYLGEELTYERVLDVLGAVDTDVFSRMYRSVLSSDVGAVFAQLEELIFSGRDLTRLTSDLMEYVRNLLLIKVSGEAAEQILDVTAENLALMREDAALAEESTLLQYIRTLSDLGARLRFAANPRVEVEVALLKLCCPQMEKDAAALAERVRVLERIIESGTAPAALKRSAASGDAASRTAPAPGEAPSQIRYAKAAPGQLQKIREGWGEITGLAQWDPTFRRLLKGAKLSFDESDSQSDVLYLVTGDVVTGLKSSPEQLTQLEESIEEMIGSRIRVRMMEPKEAGASIREIVVEENVKAFVNAPIEEE